MARIFTDGAEMGDARFWDYYHPVNYVYATSTPTPIGGTYSYHGAWLGAYKITSDLTEFYLRYRLRTSSVDQITGASILGWRHSVDAVGALSIDALKRFCAVVNSVTVATASYTIQDGVWYMIEIHVLLAAVGGRIEVFIDGTQYIDYTGDTTGGLSGHIDNIYWSTNAYTHCYVDDLALNDTTGLEDNSWCGDGIIVKMTPNGNGTDNDWTGSDGDSVNNYLLVDEYPNDGDVTYVYADGDDAGLQDQYTLTDLDYTNKTVLRIYPEARVRKSSPDGSTVKLGILPSGGADDMSAARALFSDYYARIVGNEYTTNPVTALPWVEADLDPLQFIAEIG